MKYMLDTNTCIYTIKRKPVSVLQSVMRCNAGELCISSITYSELMYGVEKSVKRDQNILSLMLFLSSVKIEPYGDSAALEYGKIRAILERKGTPIGNLDTLIAAHAMALDVTLVTHNTSEFARVEGLKLEDWY